MKILRYTFWFGQVISLMFSGLALLMYHLHHSTLTGFRWNVVLVFGLLLLCSTLANMFGVQELFKGTFFKTVDELMDERMRLEIEKQMLKDTRMKLLKKLEQE